MRAARLRARTVKHGSTRYIRLKGVDMSADPSQIGEDFSPWCPNLISDNGGNPEKRPGWRVLHTVEGPLNGLWHGRIGTDRFYFAHGGTKLYAWKPDFDNTPKIIRDGLNNAHSSGFLLNERFWILTGKEYLVYGLFEEIGKTEKTLQCKSVTDIAYVPTVAIARSPSGGGTPYENINLLGKKQKNSFLTTDIRTYQLSATKLLSVDKVILNDKELNDPADYTADLIKGRILISMSMPSPPIAGKDNLIVTFSKEYEGYTDRILKCTLSVGYGYGTNDRIFFSGNPAQRNTDWFSGLGDPSYVADLNYSKIGGESTAIMGYQRLGEFLAIIKEDNQQDSTIFLRSAQLNNGGEVVFPIRQGIAGVGAVSPYAFAVLKDEPLFLSRTGVYAITSNVITAERTVMGRSYFIDARLTKESALNNALAVEWNGYYVLTINNRAYILDGNSAKENIGQNSSDYAYRCYHWDNVPATALMEDNGVLWFGTADGRICHFNTDIQANKYNDDGKPISAQWATKADDDGDFMVRKTMLKKGSGVMIKPYTRSSVKVLLRSDNDCLEKTAKNATMDIWDWQDIDFSRIEFASNDTPRVVPFNTKMKKYITLQIIVENSVINEGFGVYGIIKRFVLANAIK